jgi:hypothetical protein
LLVALLGELTALMGMMASCCSISSRGIDKGAGRLSLFIDYR